MIADGSYMPSRNPGGQAKTLEQACWDTFQMEPHQVRYLLETFRPDSICEAFLLWPPQVAFWRRRLGIARMRPGMPTTNGARCSMGPGMPLRAFA